MCCCQRWLSVACAALLRLTVMALDARVAPAPLLTPWQEQFLLEARGAALAASQHAELELIKAFDTPGFRLELASQGVAAAQLAVRPATELLADVKDALNSLEFLFSFGYDAASAKLHPGQPGWSIDGIDRHGHIPTLWELKVDGKAGSMPDQQWKLVDAEETGLYRQQEFAKPAEPNITEAALRPSYVSGNLAHFDAGIWEFGVYAPVYRQSALKERAVMIGVDGGGWETVCNTSASDMNKAFRILRYIVPCNAIYSGGNRKVIFGTIDHLLHSFYANTQTFGPFGESLARRMYQLLVPGASMHPLEDNMYLEAAFFGPARMEDMKLFVASFPDVFGTPDADLLREFCKRHRLPLAWAIGGGKLRRDLDKTHPFMWLPYEPLVQWPVNGARLLDPSSWASMNAEAPSGSADLWASIEANATTVRQQGNSLDTSTIASWWATLKAGGGAVSGLRGKSCLDQLDLCFGTSSDARTAGQCLCRHLPSTSIAEAETVLV